MGQGEVIRLGLRRRGPFGGDLGLARRERADRALGQIVTEGGAELAPEEDDLEVAAIPGLLREGLLQIAFGALDRASVGESPASGQAVDVRVDRERGHPVGLGHDDAGGLVAHAGERLEELPVGLELAARVDDLGGGRPQVLGLGGRQPDLTDQLEDALGTELEHLLGRAGLGEQRRGDLVDLLVGGLGRQRHRHQQRVGIGVVQRDRRIGIEIVEHRSDPFDLLRSTHPREPTARAPGAQ